MFAVSCDGRLARLRKRRAAGSQALPHAYKPSSLQAGPPPPLLDRARLEPRGLEWLRACLPAPESERGAFRRLRVVLDHRFKGAGAYALSADELSDDRRSLTVAQTRDGRGDQAKGLDCGCC